MKFGRERTAKPQFNIITIIAVRVILATKGVFAPQKEFL